MKLFLDTAIADEWQPIPGCAAIAGVTTNPTLVVQAGLQVRLSDYFGLIEQATQRGIAELMLQLPSPNPEDTLDWARQLSQTAQSEPVLQLTFKLPCHSNWQAAHTALKRAGFQTLLTGVANPVQLMWASEQGADYVAPYFSRLEAAGKELAPFIQAVIAVQQAGGPKLMAASVKTEGLFSALLAGGAYACTVKPSFLQALVQDSVTESAMIQFAKDCALAGF